MLEIFTFQFWPTKLTHEMVNLADGGQLAISWNSDETEGKYAGVPEKGTDDTRPILAIIPGLSGSSQNIYGSGLMLEATKRGYKVCVILQRGSDDMPVTCDRITCSTCW